MHQPSDAPTITKLLDLSGRRALVTGASGNIGCGIAKRLAEAGAEVILHYRSGKEYAEAAEKALLPDCVVNNAAMQPVQALPDITLADWQEIMAANLDSAFLVTQAAANSMRQRKVAGSIVNIASIEGIDPASGHSHYATTKAGLIMFTRACALEYGGDQIRVNDRVPLGRMVLPNDVSDAVLFLLSPAARWISGANLVVDGGMSAQSKW